MNKKELAYNPVHVAYGTGGNDEEKGKKPPVAINILFQRNNGSASISGEDATGHLWLTSVHMGMKATTSCTCVAVFIAGARVVCLGVSIHCIDTQFTPCQ